MDSIMQFKEQKGEGRMSWTASTSDEGMAAEATASSTQMGDSGFLGGPILGEASNDPGEGVGNGLSPKGEKKEEAAPMTAASVVASMGETVVGMMKQFKSSEPPGRSKLKHETQGQWTMASNRGAHAVVPPPNFDRDEEYFRSMAKGSNAFQWAQRSDPSDGNANSSDGSSEVGLVEELCAPDGDTPHPPPDKLHEFGRSVPMLNPEMLCPALLDKLGPSQHWIVHAKALCLMETAVRQMDKFFAATDNTESSNPYADFFHTCSAEIIPFATHNHTEVREPGQRLLRALGVPLPTPTQAAHMAATATPQFNTAATPQTENLLDLDAFPSTTTAQSSNVDSLLGGLHLQAGPSAPQAEPAFSAVAPSDPFLDSAPVAAAAPVGDNDIFGNVTMKPSPTFTSQQAGSGSNEFDFIGGGGASAPATSPFSTAQSVDPLLSLAAPDAGAISQEKYEKTKQAVAHMQTTAAYQQNAFVSQPPTSFGAHSSGLQRGNSSAGVPMTGGAATRSTPLSGGKQVGLAPAMGNVMGANSMRQIPPPIAPNARSDAVSASFSFLEPAGAQEKKQKDQSFAFLEDAMGQQFAMRKK